MANLNSEQLPKHDIYKQLIACRWTYGSKLKSISGEAKESPFLNTKRLRIRLITLKIKHIDSEDMNVHIVRTRGWENCIYAETAYRIAYEVIANILQRLLFRSWDDLQGELIHKEARGCINDFCDWKPDITFKLRTGDISSEGLSALEERLLDRNIIDQSTKILES